VAELNTEPRDDKIEYPREDTNPDESYFEEYGRWPRMVA
jgi:hypothetical protein